MNSFNTLCAKIYFVYFIFIICLIRNLNTIFFYFMNDFMLYYVVCEKEGHCVRFTFFY